MRSLFIPMLAISAIAAEKVRPAGDAGSLSAPVVGYSVQAEAREVRLILGLPGATHYSDPIAFPEGAASVRTTPGHRWLLVSRESGWSAWIPETGREIALPASGVPVAMSASGAAVAFQAAGRLKVLRGLPAGAEVAADVESPVFAGTAFAVDDAGSVVAAASESGELRLVAKDGERADAFVRGAGAVASFGFARDGMLAVAQAGSDTLELIEGVRDGSLARRTLRLPEAASASARFVNGGDGAMLLVDAESGAIHRIEGGALVRSVKAEVGVAGVEALRSRGSILLEAADGEIPRIVVDHASGDEFFYLPTIAVEKAEPAEETEQ